VTAGIDFGLTLLAKLRGDDVAKLTQLIIEYDPDAPFNAGSPEAAGPALVQQALSYMQLFDSETRQAAAEVSRSTRK
jgi:cyclohexyl-isocyanide hydratase